MAVQKDDSGRRRVQVEVEVPGAREDAWQAIATAPGISSWFVPTAAEHDADGRPVQMTCNFGPGMESIATITDWDPPHSFSAETRDLGVDGPVVTTQWSVESRGGEPCVVRVEHSLFASTDQWDSSLEAWASGWPNFFRLLRLYLAHFPGQTGSMIQLTGFAEKPKSSAWSALTEALGLEPVQVGQPCRASGSAPALAGIVERVGEGGHPEELLLRLETPAPGIAHFFAMEMGEQVLLSLRLYLYGDSAPDVTAREEPLWKTWIESHFPPATGP